LFVENAVVTEKVPILIIIINFSRRL